MMIRMGEKMMKKAKRYDEPSPNICKRVEFEGGV